MSKSQQIFFLKKEGRDQKEEKANRVIAVFGL